MGENGVTGTLLTLTIANERTSGLRMAIDAKFCAPGVTPGQMAPWVKLWLPL